ncbi:deaminase domain-containing protein [Lysinibacillus fusiformis]
MLDTLQVGLDLVGLIPGVGEIADGVNGIIYLASGDKVNAALSFGAMIPFVGWAATGGKFVKKGAGVVKSVSEGVQKVLKGPVGSVVDQVKKQVVNVKTQIQSKVAEVKQQLRQMLQSQQDEFSLAGVDRRYIEDTGTVGRNTTTPSPKPSNTQPSQNGSNKKPAEGTGKVYPTRSIDQVSEAHIIDRVKELRGNLPSNYKKSGNFAFAEVDVNSLNKKEFYASSKIDEFKGNLEEKVPEISLKPNEPIFEASPAPGKDGKPYMRDSDTEYKILNEIALKLGDDVNATGKIKLFTELDTCDSCSKVIAEFANKYKNIELEVIHNNGERLKP